MATTHNTTATSLLAQYLARENLTVVHSATASTASIDLANRVLELPTWDTSKVGAQAKPVYHGLVGHEVAHALHTPSDRWLAAQEEIAGKGSSDHARAVAQDFVNVVEDARIEKIIKREFPGLKSDFAHMYDTMWKMDAFGCKDRDLSEMRLIDRINLHFKVGTHAGVQVPFTDEERSILKRVEGAVSFDDVVSIAKDLYTQAQQEDQPEDGEGEKTQPGGSKQDGQNGKKPNPCNPGDKGESSQSDGQSSDSQDGDANADGNGDANADSDSDGENGESSGNGEDEADGMDGTDDGDEGSSDKAEKVELNKDAKGKVADIYVPSDAPIVPLGASTQRNMSKFVGGLVNIKIDEEPIRVPNIDPTSIVVEPSEFLSLIERGVIHSYYGDRRKLPPATKEIDAAATTLFAEMTRSQKPSVDLMVRRFEMRKAAKDFARQSSCKSGRISTRELSNYRFSDDIFDRITIKRDEKNHGIVILIDWSGSMSGMIYSVVVQIGGILQFCRRVGIPAEVYFFSSLHNKWAEERFNRVNESYNNSKKPEDKRIRSNAIRYGLPGASYSSSMDWYREEAMDFTDHVCHLAPGTTAKGGHIILKAFSLFKVYDAKMDNRKFAATFGRLLVLANTLGGGASSSLEHSFTFPEALGMGDTPLDESILAMREIVNKFRKSSNSKVTFISMSDGEGQGLTNMYHYTTRGKTRQAEDTKGATKTVTTVLIDGSNGRRYENGKFRNGCAGDKTHSTCVKMFRDATGCEIVGIMMAQGRSATLNYIGMYMGSIQSKMNGNHSQQVIREMIDADSKKFDAEDYVAVPIDGYNSYFFIRVKTNREINAVNYKEVERLKNLKNRKMAIERQMIIDAEKTQCNRAFINRLMDIVA